MLSHNLWSLAQRLKAHSAHGTVTLSQIEIVAMTAVAEQCARDAEQLERQPAPVSHAFDPFRVTRLRLPPGVADIAKYRRERP